MRFKGINLTYLLAFSLLTFTSLTSVSGYLDNQNVVTLINSAETFQNLISDFDYISAFLFCTEGNEQCEILEKLYLDFATSMKDFAKVYAVVCSKLPASAIAVFPVCSEENLKVLPYLVYYEPPAMRVNPYTKQLSRPIEHVYEGQADAKMLANFARQHMPAFREVITSNEQLGRFLSDEYIPNKVILFTNKPQTSPLYKALASEYRNRLLFAEINESSKDLIDGFQITKYPTLLVMKPTADGQYQKHFYEGELNMDLLKTFLNIYALEKKVDRPDTPRHDTKNHQEEEPRKQMEIKMTHLTAQTFEKEVNEHERLVLVHLVKDEPFPLMTPIIEKFTQFFEYFDLNCTNEENEKFAVEKLGVRSFPSVVVLPIGKEKKLSQRKAFNKAHDLQDIMHDVSDLIGDKVIPVTAVDMQGVITNSLTKKRPTVIMIYDTTEPSMTYRMLAQLSKYEDKVTFAKLKDPPAELYKNFQLDKLPALVTALVVTNPEDELELDPTKIQLVKYAGRFNYEDLSRYFDMFLPEDERLQQMSISKKVNEVTTQEDLNKFCPPDSKVCVVGLLNGNRDSDASKAKLDESIATLTHILKKYSHLPFIWIDAICHSEVLLSLNVQSESVPTVVLYSPAYKEYYQLVGTFDSPSIVTFLEKVLKKRLSSYSLPDGLKIEKKNCEEVHETMKKLESGSGSSADDDDFMREFLEEERKKREALEKEAGGKKKKKKKYADEL